MLLTEKEAIRMLCCLYVDRNCASTRCMAWRWYDPLVDPLTGKPDAKSRRGYCGLAGKPEYEE